MTSPTQSPSGEESEMIERVARAIMSVALGEHRLDLSNPEECARAAIEAMREIVQPAPSRSGRVPRQPYSEGL